MFEEQLKSEFIELIDRWTSSDSETPETRSLISKSEFLEVIQDVIRATFGVGADLLQIKTSENAAIAFPPHNPGKFTDYNYNVDLPDRYQSLDVLPMTHCVYLCEEVCRSEENINPTICIEDPLVTERNEQFDTSDLSDLSPIVFMNEVGRSDTFEVKSPNDPKLSTNNQTEKKENVDGIWFDGKKIDYLIKKLGKAHHEISGIVKVVLTMATEIDRIKTELQQEVKHISVPKGQKSKSPLVTVTPTTPRKNIPSHKVSSIRRKSSSFSHIEDDTKLMTTSPNRATSTSFLSTQKKSPISRSMSHDPGDCKPGAKNYKYSNIRSTIPKPSPIRKPTSK